MARGPLLDKMEELPRAWHSQWGLQLLVRVDKNFNLQTINLSSQRLLGAADGAWACPGCPVPGQEAVRVSTLY